VTSLCGIPIGQGGLHRLTFKDLDGRGRCVCGDLDDDWTKAVVGVGCVYISHNRVIMLVDTAERPEDIDRVRAEAALERAKEQLRQKQSIQEYHVSQASMARAMLRLKEAGKYEVK
jgi:F-type H+-transporting ATPase subunit epsilon